MTVSAGGGVPAVFDRYRSDGYTLFDLGQLNSGGAAPAAARNHYDEVLDSAGAVRPAWDELVAGYALRGDDRLQASAARLASAVSDEGVVYNQVDGTTTIPRPWLLDAVPLLSLIHI